MMIQSESQFREAESRQQKFLLKLVLCVDMRVHPTPWISGCRMDDSVKEALDMVFVPVEDIWLGFTDATKAWEGISGSQ